MLFKVNSALKSLLIRVYPYTKWAFRVAKKISDKFYHGALTMIFLWGFAGITLKLEKVGSTFSSLNPCPSLPSVATGNRK